MTKEIFDVFGIESLGALKKDKLDADDITDELIKRANEIYEDKSEHFGESLRELERVVLLKVVDGKWMEHIDNMDELKNGIGLRAYGQKDPVVQYRFEGGEMFDEMIQRIQNNTIALLLKLKVQVEEIAEADLPQHSSDSMNNFVQPIESIKAKSVLDEQPVNTNQESEKQPQQPVRVEKTVGRNDPCPCGSGKKYKNCHGK